MGLHVIFAFIYFNIGEGFENYYPPASSGLVGNISYPFRLKDQPKYYGEPKYELSCENNETILDVEPYRYHVQQIWEGYVLSVIDPTLKLGFHVNTCSLNKVQITSPGLFLINSFRRMLVD